MKNTELKKVNVKQLKTEIMDTELRKLRKSLENNPTPKELNLSELLVTLHSLVKVFRKEERYSSDSDDKAFWGKQSESIDNVYCDIFRMKSNVSDLN